jgi:predicted regulator of Ras-like GTPase activity (Roadblock/LC7/MglB family)
MDKDALLKNVNQISGIRGSMLVSKDGLVLANSLPESTDPQLVSAVVSSMFTNIDVQSKRMQRGQLRRFTVETEHEGLTLMQADLNGETLLVFSEIDHEVDLNELNQTLDNLVKA